MAQENIPVMDPFASGIYQALKPAVIECDQSINEVMTAQEALSKQVEDVYVVNIHLTLLFLFLLTF